MLPEILPTWEEAQNAVNSGNGSVLDRFIYEHEEHNSMEGVRFRQQLREVLKEATSNNVAEPQTTIRSNGMAPQPEFY